MEARADDAFNPRLNLRAYASLPLWKKKGIILQ